MFSAGLFIAIGLLFIMWKLPWKWKLTLTSYPITCDIVVFTLLTLLHWGTYTGVMAATVGALVCSIVLSVVKWLIGHLERGRYIPGKFNVGDKLV